MLCSLKYHQRSGTHVVSLALWQSGGRVTSVIQTLPSHVLRGILALSRTLYRNVHRSGPFSPAVALALDAAFFKLGVVHTRRRCAFAADALRRMKRCYVIVVLGLREVHLMHQKVPKLKNNILQGTMNKPHQGKHRTISQHVVENCTEVNCTNHREQSCVL